MNKIVAFSRQSRLMNALNDSLLQLVSILKDPKKISGQEPSY